MNFGAKARAVRERGVQERGNFTPSGTPLKMYKYWLDESEGTKARRVRNGLDRENFCHYWRVVAFWAPLIFLKNKFLDFSETNWGMAIIVGSVILAIITGGSMGFGLMPFLLSLAAVLSFITGIVSGIVLGNRDYADNRERNAWIVAALFGFITFVPVYGLARLHANWKKDWDKYVEGGFIVLIGGAAAFVVGLILVATWSEWGWLGLLGLVGILVGLALIATGLAFLADYISGRRQIREDAAFEAREAYFEEHGEMPTAEPREPGLLSRFFSGVGDFIVFVFQIVRVKKWKICPIVEVPKG